MVRKHRERSKRSPKVQQVMVVKPKRKRRGPRITRILKDKTTAHLCYVDAISLDTGTAAITSHVFRCNSIFDPDFTTTGHQPLMRDEYFLLYQSYRVLSSKIKVTPIPVTNDILLPSLYGVYQNESSSLIYSLGTSVIEDQRNKGSWGILGNQAELAQFKSKSASFNAKRNLGADGMLNTTLQTSNPTNVEDTAFFHIWSASIAGNNPGAVTFLVQMDFIVEYTDPAVLTPS